jgi:hypothetical protein
MANDLTSAPAVEKKRLISRKAWGVIAIISALVIVTLPPPGMDFATIAGRFIGGLLFFGGFWAVVMGVGGWLSRRRAWAPTQK